MSLQSASFQDINFEIVKTLENLKSNRENLNKDIDSLEQYREKIIEQIKSCEKELENTEGAQLQDKVVVFDVYEKLIRDSDDAYSKIVNSTQKLYKMVKEEQNLLSVKKKYK